MAIVKNLVRKLVIPHEDDQWMRLRQLSWKELEENRDKKIDQFLARAKDMATAMDLIQDSDKEETKDPLAEFDLGLLLVNGIVEWSYDDELTKENVEQLDEVTAKWAAKEIIGVPTDEELGKDSSPSTEL